MKRPTMVRRVKDYLRLRRSLGFQMRSQGEMLLQFGRYLDGAGHRGPLTTETAPALGQSSPPITKLSREAAVGGAMFRPVSVSARRPDGSAGALSGAKGLLSPAATSL